MQISCAYEQALPKANNPIPPAQFDLTPTATKVTGQPGGLRRFRRDLFPVYSLPPFRQLLQGIEVRLALVHYVH